MKDELPENEQNWTIEDLSDKNELLCSNCKYWNTESIHIYYVGEQGQCTKADCGASAGIFYVDDDIQSYDPHLITRRDFSCNQHIKT